MQAEDQEDVQMSASGYTAEKNPLPVYAVRLRELREARRMKRRTVSELCGLSKNMIAHYERGEKEPKVTALLALSDFYGVSVDYILGIGETHKK